MKTKYIFIAAIILLTAIVYLQINLHDQTQKELIEKFKTEQEITMRHFTEEVETFLQEETDRIKSFVLFQGLQHGKMSEIKTLVDEDFEYFKKDHVKTINIYDKNGTVIYSTNKEAIGDNHAESTFFKWATAPENKSEPFIASDSIENKNRSLQMPVFSLLIAMPVYQNVEKTEKVKYTQRLIGVVTIIIDLEETLTNLLPRISANVKKENVTILDNRGTLWFQTEHPEMVMKNIYVHNKSCFQCHNSFDYIGKMLSEKQGRIDYGLKKGPKKIASFSSFEFKNIAWTVVLNHEYSEVTRFLDQSFMQSLIIIGSIIFTLLGFTIISFRSNRLRIRAQEEVMLWREKLELEEKIRESEARYKELSKQLEAILDHIPGLVFYKDKKNNFIRVNKYLALAHGKEKEELEGKNLSNFYPEEDATKYQQDDLEVINSGIAKLNIEEPWQTAEGLKWVSTSKIPFAGDNGEFIGIIGMSIDITERKWAEETISNERLLLRTLIDNIPDSIYSKDLACRKTLTNLTELRFMGVKSESEVLGKDDFAFYPKELADKFFADDQSVMQSGIPVLNREEYILDENGQKRWLLSSKLPLRDKEGLIIGLVGIGHDITERKLAEEELRASQQLIEEIINTIPVRIFWKDRNCVYLGCNSIFARDAGLSDPKDLIGKDDSQMGWRDQAELYRSDDRQVMESGIPILLNEEPQTTPEGNTIIMLTNKIPLKNSLGEIYGIMGTAMNVTERIAAVQEIKLKNEQLQKLNAEKDKFFSIIAHDLRGPFSGFLGLTQIMAEELPSLTMAQVQELAISMKNSATNLYSLLENLLQWARMQQGAISFTLQVVQLLPLVDECIATALETARNKGIDISYTIPENTAVFADSNMLQTVIRNLVSNAMKFTPGGGKILVSAKTTSDKSVEISVKDTGIGMSSALVDNLFRPDVETSRKGTKGEPSSGLGLLLCKEFVEKNGGKLWIESEEGNGSTFSFTLPIESI